MKHEEIAIKTSGEKFYEITKVVQSALTNLLEKKPEFHTSGLLYLFLPHTSCALTISEAFDPSAAKDMEQFLQHLARRDLNFITHTTEGDDDSPSHMKSILLQQSLTVMVENGKIVLGTWQGIYLAEFRDSEKQRKLIFKFMPDSN